jgi:hypothetical protein
MDFIHESKSVKFEPFLDSKEQVREAREVLIKSTEEAYKILELAKVSSWENAHRIWVK